MFQKLFLAGRFDSKVRAPSNSEKVYVTEVSGSSENHLRRDQPLKLAIKAAIIHSITAQHSVVIESHLSLSGAVFSKFTSQTTT